MFEVRCFEFRLIEDIADLLAWQTGHVFSKGLPRGIETVAALMAGLYHPSSDVRAPRRPCRPITASQTFVASATPQD
jgi:hypothetical protein